jgi:4-hydroxy-tetrahydrodipicolinate synthase
MMATDFKGVITALITPFRNGALDLNSFRRLLAQQVSQGVDALVINGTTAESPTLKPEEIKTLFDVARAETKLPLIVGTGSNSTAATIEFTEKVQAWRPDGVLVVVPYYNRPPQRGLKAHFLGVAKVSKAPVILYNVPGRTVASLEPETAGEISREAGNVVAIKDATGDMKILERLQESCRPGFTFLSGDDGTCVDFAARGGHGTIAVASHIIGAEMRAAMQKARAGDTQAPAEYTQRFAALIKALYTEANPIPVKKAVQMMGVIDSAEMRLPLMELDSQFHKDLQACLKNLGKI